MRKIGIISLLVLLSLSFLQTEAMKKTKKAIRTGNESDLIIIERKEVGKAYYCKKCDEKGKISDFTTKRDCIKHISKKHKINIPYQQKSTEYAKFKQNQIGEFMCPFYNCTFASHTGKHLLKHIKSQHDENFSYEKFDPDNFQKKQKIGKFVCPWPNCKLATYDGNWLLKHIKLNHYEYPSHERFDPG